MPQPAIEDGCIGHRAILPGIDLPRPAADGGRRSLTTCRNGSGRRRPIACSRQWLRVPRSKSSSSLLVRCMNPVGLYPGDVLVEIAANALALAGVGRDRPLEYGGLRERYLPEIEFRWNVMHQKSHAALRAAAMIHAGVPSTSMTSAAGGEPTTSGCSQPGASLSSCEQPQTEPTHRLSTSQVSSGLTPRPPAACERRTTTSLYLAWVTRDLYSAVTATLS